MQIPQTARSFLYIRLQMVERVLMLAMARPRQLAQVLGQTVTLLGDKQRHARFQLGMHLRDDAKGLAYLKANGLEAGKFICVIPRKRYTPYYEVNNVPRVATDDIKEGVQAFFEKREPAWTGR